MGNTEDSFWCVRQTSDGGYVASGVKNGDAWLVKLAGSEEGVEHKKTSDSGLSQT